MTSTVVLFGISRKGGNMFKIKWSNPDPYDPGMLRSGLMHDTFSTLEEAQREVSSLVRRDLQEIENDCKRLGIPPIKYETKYEIVRIN